MKRRNHIGFLKCYRCGWCGLIVKRDGSLFSIGSGMEFSKIEYTNAEPVNGDCCIAEAHAHEYERYERDNDYR